MQDNTTAERPSFVSHLECSLTGARHPADRLIGLSERGQPLLVRYDLAALGNALTKDALVARAPDLWRYREFLPVRRAADIVSLGETMTPLLSAPRLAAALGGGELLVKDEGRLPTGSFKGRGLALAGRLCGARRARIVRVLPRRRARHHGGGDRPVHQPCLARQRHHHRARAD